MSAVPVRSEAEARANATYDALLWALSRPGKRRHLPAADETPIIEALIDRECRVFVGDPVLMPVVLRNGAAIAPVAEADHVFAGSLADLETLHGLCVGSDLYPDDGATLIVRVRFGTGLRLELSGPGVDGVTTVSIAALPEGFWAWRAAQIRYPIGFDMVLVDGDQIIGLPRSTKVEVL